MATSIVDELKHIRMSPALLETVERAARYANEQSHGEVGLEHVLLALTEDHDAAAVLTTSNVEIIQLKTDVSNQVGRIDQRVPADSDKSIALSDTVKRIFDASAQAAKGRRDAINGAIVLAAIVGDGSSTAAHLLRTHGMTFEAAIKALQSAGSSAGNADATAEEHSSESVAPQPEPGSPAAASPVNTAPTPSAANREDAPRPRIEPRPSLQDQSRSGPPSGPAPHERPPVHPSSGAAGFETQRLAKKKPFEHVPTEFGYDAIRKRQEAQRRPGMNERRIDVPPVRGAGDTTFPSADRDRLHERSQPHTGPPTQSGFPPSDVSQTGPPTRPPPGGSDAKPYRPPPPVPLPGEPGAPGSGQRPVGTPAAGAGPLGGVRGGMQPSPGGGLSPSFGEGAYRGPPASGPHSVPRTAPPAGAQGNFEGAPGQHRGARAPRGVPNPAGGHARAQQTGGQQGPRTNVEAGQLIENIPRLMRVAMPTIAEVRIAKADIQGVAEGLQGGGPVHRHDVLVTKAMTVRLRAPDGGFFIEAASPETQWVDNSFGLISDEFASWRWTVTPQKSGRKRLQVIVSARTVGADGLAAETALPDQVIEVRIRANYGRAAKRWMGWIAAAVVGGLFARFGEQIFDVASKIAAPFLAS